MFFLYLPDILPSMFEQIQSSCEQILTLWGVEVKIILTVISLSDNLHDRQNLPASQTGLGFIFPECRSGECR